ncbi:MAG TPA: FKBP-type peptidyl-prolyl cis-trans isomerase [Candidatus Angelobacter sp.]|nr:FKBP-type peptidyl-prolyl cis-trans isomerase [Candidatus Angelobacter sp.]
MAKTTLTSWILALALVATAGFAAAQGSSAPKKNSAQGAAKTTQAAPAATPTPAAQPTATPNPNFKSDKERQSYAVGMNIGESLHRQPVDLDSNSLIQGLKDSMAGGKTLMTDEEAKAALTELGQQVRAKQEEKVKQAAETNKKEGEAFLAANKTKEGVVTTPSGLQYKILKAGTGPKPTAADKVVCNYRGTLINGTEFDSSYKRGQPATFPVGQVIKGWTEALQLMPVGSKWQLFIPPDLAYGERGAGNDIGPDSTLIFEVELLSIEPKEAPAQK